MADRLKRLPEKGHIGLCDRFPAMP